MKKSRQNLALFVATLMATSVMGGCAKGTSASSSSTTSTADGNDAVQAEAVTLKGWGAARFDGTTGIQSYSDQSSWKQNEADTGIRVDWTVVCDRLSLNTATFVDMDVSIGQHYSYKIESINLSSKSSTSNVEASVTIE